mmetsp:Transcript_13756/g.24682  ORF Transcript_13756/g.24682 Transcript_13756/m.24682 type:complete len:366 (-) Transcript_13756:418-1515(-)
MQSEEDFIRTVGTRVQEAIEYFRCDKHFQSSRALRALTKDAEDLEKGSASADGSARRFLDAELSKYSEVGLIRQIEEEVLDALEMAKSEEHWELSYDGASAKVWYKQGTDGLHSFKAQGELVAPVVNLCALLNELELMKELFWFVKKVDTLQDLGRVRRTFHSMWALVWPLSDREAPLLGYGVDGMDEDDCFLTIARSLRDSDIDAEGNKLIIPAIPRGTVRMQADLISFHFSPISPSRTLVTLVARVDPKLTIFPVALINWCSRFFIRLSLMILEEKARNIENLPHGAVMKSEERKDVYSWMQNRLEEYWGSRGRLSELHNGILDDAERKHSIDEALTQAAAGKAKPPPGSKDKMLAAQLLRKK